MKPSISRRFFFRYSVALPISMATLPQLLRAQSSSPLPLIREVDLQPLAAQVRRLIDALDFIGAPLNPASRNALDKALTRSDVFEMIEAIQRVLDPHCLVAININPESRVKVSRGPADAQLVEGGWRQFLIKVHNEAGSTAELQGVSPQAQSVFVPSDRNRYANSSDQHFMASSVARLPDTDRWLDLQLYNGQPLTATLSGLSLEYRIVSLYSRDAGKREATLMFHVGQGTQDLGFRSELPILFDSIPAYPIRLRVADENGRPTIGAFLIRDAQGRVYPSQAKRLAPDFAFQPHVYRGEGEELKLPAGTYSVSFWRGPESLPEEREVTIAAGQDWKFQVRRWIDPATWGWWSGDHHIHGAGCAHYVKPTEGVSAEDMIRHVVGEDLKVGANLIWGPGFDYQKQYFTSRDDATSRPPYLLHYDMEVSGFGSHVSGHVVLLGLKDLMYPGTVSTKDWPTLCLNTFRWAKRQGAITGFAHSGLGLIQQGNQLPTYEVPQFDGIGANEYIVDVTHTVEGPEGTHVPAVDFISAVDTPPVWELNIWYHTLNAGYRTRLAGETDFPCVYSNRVGMGRSYVRLKGKPSYLEWCRGLQQGCAYVSEGKSHFLKVKANGLNLGANGSELRLKASRKVLLEVTVAALLDKMPDPVLHDLPPPRDVYETPAGQAFWHIERARIGNSNQVPVEVIVNGYPIARQTIVADGRVHELRFEVPIERSSWIALRIFPSSHTNPFFVLVGGKPIRASRRSVEWCLKSVDQCWSQKQRAIDPKEMEDARLAYEHARVTYRRLLTECELD